MRGKRAANRMQHADSGLSYSIGSKPRIKCSFREIKILDAFIIRCSFVFEAQQSSLARLFDFGKTFLIACDGLIT